MKILGLVKGISPFWQPLTFRTYEKSFTFLQTLPLKDFRDEIRARRDLEKFLVSPVVLLDVPHTSKYAQYSPPKLIITKRLDKM